MSGGFAAPGAGKAGRNQTIMTGAAAAS
ncbi:hypothetical protein ACTIVE_9260 [Actinomadura verrucosospora]|uniref:Uncharacterized protein n=1 Tax=Actinomadura verrucosospora TaxID=46165 RepID=A0A7D4ACB7_ACTVE|nr:hypothetical protein ACTIVE_9260 [Actinomadura verrucosospora]